jgi:hypothetical protein
MDKLTQGELTVERKDWIDTLGYGSETFKRSLVDLGIDNRLLESDIAQYEKAQKIFESRIGPKGPDAHTPESNSRDALIIKARQDGFIQKIRDLVAGREYVVEDSVVRELKVKLFWLNCPDVDKSKVVYKDEVGTEVKGSFEIKVLGTGMGTNLSVKISYASEFEAADGACKSIFVHYPLLISLVKVYENGDLVGQGLRSEVSESGQREFKLGIGSETKEDSESARARAYIKEEIIPLADDTTDSAQTYSRTEESLSGMEITTGLEAFNMELKNQVEFKRSNKVTLTFKLPAGRNYLLRRDQYGRGIWWA